VLEWHVDHYLRTGALLMLHNPMALYAAGASNLVTSEMAAAPPQHWLQVSAGPVAYADAASRGYRSSYDVLCVKLCYDDALQAWPSKTVSAEHGKLTCCPCWNGLCIVCAVMPMHRNIHTGSSCSRSSHEESMHASDDVCLQLLRCIASCTLLVCVQSPHNPIVENHILSQHTSHSHFLTLLLTLTIMLLASAGRAPHSSVSAAAAAHAHGIAGFQPHVAHDS
jgi:hypothetical protein